MIRVLVADDHPVFRAGLKRTLEDSGDMVVAGEASTGEETLTILGKVQADVLLMDVFMPGMGFLEVLRRVRLVRPSLPTLVVSMQPEEQCALRAFRAGASGYLAKDRSLDQVVGAVRTVAEGRKYFSPELAERMVSSLSTPSARLPHEALSDREYEVLCMIGAGKSVKEIAYQLTLSPKTVGTYRARLLKKMNVRSGAELVRYAVQQGLTV
jgi:DNA-binding NarL/FixJ family response regulator